MEALQLVRALHILFAITWAGAAVYRTRVVDNLLDGEVADRFYARAGHGPFMGVAAIGTVAFGGAILAFGEYTPDTMGMGPFVVLNLGMTAATAALLVGLFGHLPNDRHLQRLAAARLDGSGDDGAYVARRRRDALLGRVSMALIGVAMLGMVGFRLL